MEIDEGIEEYPSIVRQALKNYWKEKTAQEVEIEWENELFGNNQEQVALISFLRLSALGFLVESAGSSGEINAQAINNIENDYNYAKDNYEFTKYHDNKFYVILLTLVYRAKFMFDHVLENCIKTANYVVPSEKHELLRVSTEISHPTKIDKYLLLSQKYFPIFRQNFPDIDIEIIKILTRNIYSSIHKVDTVNLYKIYGGMKVGYIGDNELLVNEMMPDVPNIMPLPKGAEVRFLSCGFVYSSVLKTFPLIFPDEYEHIDKKDTAMGLKLFNSKGGYLEEMTSTGQTIKHSVKCPKLNLDNTQFYLSDKKYLMADSIRSISSPYVSGWVHFNCNRDISKDVDLVYVVDKPYPASVLRIYAKVKLIPHYLN